MADVVKILMQGREQFAELRPRGVLDTMLEGRELFGDVAELQFNPLRAAFRAGLSAEEIKYLQLTAMIDRTRGAPRRDD